MDINNYIKYLLKNNTPLDVISFLVDKDKNYLLNIQKEIKIRKYRTIKDLSSKEIENIYASFKKGKSIRNIASVNNLFRKDIDKLIDDRYPNQRRKKKTLTNKEKEIIYRMYEEGNEPKMISKIILVSQNYIIKLLKLKNIYRYKIKKTNKLTISSQQDILKLIKDGVSIKVIADKFNVHISTIYRLIKKQK